MLTRVLVGLAVGAGLLLLTLYHQADYYQGLLGRVASLTSRPVPARPYIRRDRLHRDTSVQQQHREKVKEPNLIIVLRTDQLTRLGSL